MVSSWLVGMWRDRFVTATVKYPDDIPVRTSMVQDGGLNFIALDIRLIGIVWTLLASNAIMKGSTATARSISSCFCPAREWELVAVVRTSDAMSALASARFSTPSLRRDNSRRSL